MTETKNELSLRFLAEPNDVNFGGNVHGGIIMKWIDQTGYACACNWSKHYSVTVYVGGIRFFQPIKVGHMVQATAKVIYTGNSSMHILVNVYSKNLKLDTYKLTTRCIIIFVAMDEDGHPTPVPAWVPVTEEDKKLEVFAQKSAEARDNLVKEVQPFAPDNDVIS
jgi:uncharacterized protein (TIGR00369 family)